MPQRAADIGDGGGNFGVNYPLLHCYMNKKNDGKSLFVVGKSNISMAISSSCVKSPEELLDFVAISIISSYISPLSPMWVSDSRADWSKMAEGNPRKLPSQSLSVPPWLIPKTDPNLTPKLGGKRAVLLWPNPFLRHQINFKKQLDLKKSLYSSLVFLWPKYQTRSVENYVVPSYCWLIRLW